MLSIPSVEYPCIPVWKKTMIASLSFFLLSGFLSSCSNDTPIPDESGSESQQWIEIGENSNMSSSGKISSQYNDSFIGSDLSKIVDGDNNTTFATPHTSFYITWAGSASTAVNIYSLTSGTSATNDPKSWKLMASRDNQNWILLDTKTDQIFDERQEIQRYSIKNETRFKYYKLEILANNGGTSTHIAEWTLQEPSADLDISTLIAAYASGQSNSSLTPMGKQYENKTKTTAEIREWLLNPENEPDLPAHIQGQGFSLRAFDVTLYPFGLPKPADANQHSMGNCGSVAASAAMAYQNPEFVKSLIKDNGNKTYTVSMFDPQGQPIEVCVSNKFIAGSNMILSAVSGKGRVATWATVLEKAIMKYNAKYKVNVDIGGIGCEHTIPLFTGNGNSFAFKPKALTNEELAKVVKASLLQGKFVLGGFRLGGVPLTGIPLNQNNGGSTVTAHVFTMVHSITDDALFAARNPWGGNQNLADGINDGIFVIPNDNTIPPLMDLRIIEPGLSGTNGTTEQYVPPVL